MNDVVSRLQRRALALAALRRTLDGRGFLEVDTPLLVQGPGLEPHIDPLCVHVRRDATATPERRFLITSPELAMKKLLAQGARRLYQLGPVFRDGETTKRHAIEFTMLEWYRAPGSIEEILQDTLALLQAVAAVIVEMGTQPAFDVAQEPERLRVTHCFERFAGIDLRRCLLAMREGDVDALPRAARAAGLTLRPGADFEDAFFQVMGECVEPRIGQHRLAVVEQWPTQMAALARTCDEDDLFANRFEIYGRGLELCNAFDELTDPMEQRRRFVSDNAARARLGKELLPIDEDFLALLPQMPRSAGNALGVDRALMLLSGAAAIEDVRATGSWSVPPVRDQ